MANDSTTQPSFLGTGWSFPPTFDRKKRKVELVSDELDIQQSLRILLGTTLGERTMVPKFGCNLDRLQFEPVSVTLSTYIKDLVETSILLYETRIRLVSFDLDDSDRENGILSINIEFTIKATNTRSNLVYPYYLEEATSSR